MKNQIELLVVYYIKHENTQVTSFYSTPTVSFYAFSQLLHLTELYVPHRANTISQ